MEFSTKLVEFCETLLSGESYYSPKSGEYFLRGPRIVFTFVKTNCAMEIPRGNSRDDIKTRRQIIKDFYANWIAQHPDKKVWNRSLNAFIHVKFDSINEALGHAPRSFEATCAQMHLAEALSEAVFIEERPPKYGDQNQKKFSKMLFLRWKSCRLLIGRRKTSGEYEMYYLSGGQKNKAVR